MISEDNVNDEDLLAWNQLGLIPGPNESLNDFKKRVQYCLNLKETLGKELNLPIPTDSTIAQALIEEVSTVTKRLFDISPTWVPIIFSNHHLTPWHGGCAWIFQLTDSTPTGAFFQLREAFAKSKRYLGLYDRQELIAHETAHVGRMLFNEPRFEEILAYRTSNSRFRRWLGPIIQSSWESVLFVLLVFFAVVIEFGTAFVGSPELYHSVTWLKFLPLLLFGAGVVRVWIRQRQFSRCLNKLKTILGDELKANAVIYRLEDNEIIAFCKMTPEDICKYAAIQENDSLRWQIINKAYKKTKDYNLEIDI